MPVTFYVYAEDEAEIKALERTLHDMVDNYYHKGVFVRSSRLSDAIRAFGNSSIVKNFLAK